MYEDKHGIKQLSPLCLVSSKRKFRKRCPCLQCLHYKTTKSVAGITLTFTCMLACHDVDMIAPVVVSQKWFWGHPRISFMMGAVLVRIYILSGSLSRITFYISVTQYLR